MKVLFITLGLPYPPIAGAQIRDYHLITRIAREYSVRIMALVESRPDPTDVEHLKSICEGVDFAIAPTALSMKLARRLHTHVRARRPLATLPFVHEEAIRAVRDLSADWRPDLVQIEHSFLAPYLEALPPSLSCKTVLSLHNVGSIQYRRMLRMKHRVWGTGLALVKWLMMRNWEKRYARRFDGIVVVSETEARHLDGLGSGVPATVVPNGVDTGTLPFLDRKAGRPELLFVGNLSYPPNVDGVLHFSRDILPLVHRRVPEATFTVVGRDPPPAVRRLSAREGVTVAGFVEDLLPFYRRAAACIVPLRAGGGTRLKILEAMALGRAVVTTSIGCEGIKVVSGTHVLIGDNTQIFADHVAHVLQDPASSAAMVQAARRLVEVQYDWSHSAARLSLAYQQFFSTSRNSAGA